MVQINQSFEVGGVETMMAQLCSYIDFQRFDVIACSLSTDMEMANNLPPEVKVVTMGYKTRQLRGISLFFKGISLLLKLGKWLRCEQPHVVHVHAYFSMYLLIALAVHFYSKQTKVVKTIHTSGLFYTSRRYVDRFRLWVEQKATALNTTYVVGISEQVYQIALCHFSRTAVGVRMIYNGVDLSLFSQNHNDNLRRKLLDNKKLLVVYVARMVDGKNHFLLLDIWNRLKVQKVNTAKLVLVGDGDNIEKVKAMIKEKNLSNEVLCLGRSSEVAHILSVCDFALFPSDYEGFSLSLIEKMASYLPVLASELPSFKEVITSSKEGYIVPLSDLKDWEEKIKLLINDEKLRKQLGLAARKRSLDFSVESMVGEYEKLYRYACKH